MKFNQKIKSIIKNKINKLFSLFGYETLFVKLSPFEKALLKFKSNSKIKSFSYKEKIDYFKKIKILPGPEILKEWEEILIEWENCNPKVFERLEKFFKIREKFLREFGISEFNIDFVDKAIFTGAFGMPFHFQVLCESKKLLMHNTKFITLLDKAIFEYPKKWSITNKKVFEYMQEHLTLITETSKIKNLKLLEKYLTLPISLAIPINKKFLMVEIAKNVVNTEMYKKNINGPFLKLSEKDELTASKSLIKIGIDIEKDWFVTLHVRESGWHEVSEREFFRNGNIEDYNKAIDLIISKGGKVVRVGNNKMKKMTPRKGLIDYAHSEFKSEDLDIFLAAKSRFCIATSSGFFNIAGLFNVPIVMTNTAHTIIYFRLKKRDIFVPPLLKSKKDNQFLNFKKIMFPPYSMVNTNVEKKYKEDLNVELIKNSEDDIFCAVEEMINRLDSNNFENLTQNQKKLANLINENQNIYTSEYIYAHALFPNKFLEKHDGLLR